MWGFRFRRRDELSARPEPVAQRVDRVKRPIEHPADVLTRSYEADTPQFHSWVLQLEDIDPERISRRVLVSLYAEFCHVFELRAMPWGRFRPIASRGRVSALSRRR